MMEFLGDDKFDSLWQKIVSETKCWSLSLGEQGKGATEEMGSSFFALVHPSPDTRPVLWYFHLISNAFNKKHSIVYLLSSDKETKNTMMVLQRIVNAALPFVDIEGMLTALSSIIS
jgi:hypothetical protein